jgi:hypothetical protein
MTELDKLGTGVKEAIHQATAQAHQPIQQPSTGKVEVEHGER